jgi:hypothetical protein
VAGFCENGDEPSGFIRKQDIFLTSGVIISFSNNGLHHEVSNPVTAEILLSAHEKDLR